MRKECKQEHSQLVSLCSRCPYSRCAVARCTLSRLSPTQSDGESGKAPAHCRTSDERTHKKMAEPLTQLVNLIRRTSSRTLFNRSAAACRMCGSLFKREKERADFVYVRILIGRLAGQIERDSGGCGRLCRAEAVVTKLQIQCIGIEVLAMGTIGDC